MEIRQAKRSLGVVPNDADRQFAGRWCFARDQHDSRVLQPIVSLTGGADWLYCAYRPRSISRLRLTASASEMLSLSGRWLSLSLECERTALEQAATWLRADPTLQVGIAVSADTVKDSLWWHGFTARLSDMPDVARRLTVELAETTPLTRGSGHRLHRLLREAGCRLAISGYGLAYGLETETELPRVDVVKVSARAVYGRTDAAQRLAGLLRLAREKSTQVVVEAVDDAMTLALAREAGACWVQGRYVGEWQWTADEGGRT
ncbi:EAL domain-containing protein [Burkholderia ubonensis]|uniref:EAL domain-containing protein n=1 Tax=Burkholderia ubonensis TaxID=101571 RepID=UPI00075A2D1E|nr:EAL domain-containing protein [Burkholderia ubonensis]